MQTGAGKVYNFDYPKIEMTQENLEAIKRKTFAKIEKEKQAPKKKQIFAIVCISAIMAIIVIVVQALYLYRRKANHYK